MKDHEGRKVETGRMGRKARRLGKLGKARIGKGENRTDGKEG